MTRYNDQCNVNCSDFPLQNVAALMKLSLGNLLLHCPSRKYAKEIRKKKKSNSITRLIYNYFLDFYFIWYGYWNPRQFSLPEFVTEIQEVIQPVLKAYFKVSVMHSHSWDPSFWYKRDLYFKTNHRHIHSVKERLTDIVFIHCTGRSWSFEWALQFWDDWEV